MQIEPIVIEIEVGATVDRVCQAWTETNDLIKWLTARANVRAGTGGPYELFWEPAHPERNSTLGCVINSIRVNEILGFTWKGPAPYDVMNSDPPPTSVTIMSRVTGPDRTIIRIEHTGWGTGPRWMEGRAWEDRTWTGAPAQLNGLPEK
jgi:uncharacterized protein YndB with AHSA1/START domain